MANKLYGLWIPTFILIFTFLLNYLYSKPLFQLGESLIFQAQKYSSPAIDYFFIFFTFLIEPYFVILSLAIALILFRKKFEGSIISIAVFLNTYIFMAMKACLTAPRPFWTDKNIKNIGYYCPKDYGSPSGHTEFAVFIFSIYLFHFNKQKNISIIILGFLVIFLVMVSRMYLGGHSLDQVLFGFIVAACLSIIYEFGGIREKIGELLMKFKEGPTKKTVIAIFLFAHFLALLIFYRNLNRDQSFFTDMQTWINNFKEKCSFSISSSSLNESSLLAESVLMTFSLGYFFSFQNILHDSQGNNYLSGKWSFNDSKYSVFSKPLFLIVTILCLAIPVIVFIPLFKIFKAVFLAKYLLANLAALIVPYFLLKVSFKCSSTLSLIVFSEGEVSEKAKQGKTE